MPAERALAARPLLLRANAVVLVLCAGARRRPGGRARPHVLNLGPGGQDDPSFSNGVLAFTQRAATGRRRGHRAAGRAVGHLPGRAGVALDGALVAFRDSAGIVVLDWHSGTPVARVDAPAPTVPPWTGRGSPTAGRRRRGRPPRSCCATSPPAWSVVAAGDDRRPALGAGRSRGPP